MTVTTGPANAKDIRRLISLQKCYEKKENFWTKADWGREERNLETRASRIALSQPSLWTTKYLKSLFSGPLSYYFGTHLLDQKLTRDIAERRATRNALVHRVNRSKRIWTYN
ncbi:hypothetical protein C8J56DRAFT_1022368 [Mycena floridula]|nr:hypothetical protein C8J56DRAFT_1022368 [Mycena floridula]